MQLTPWLRVALRQLSHLSIVGTLVFAMLSVASTPAGAQFYTLRSGNSRLEIDTSAEATGYDWVVENVDHLNELSNWFRVGNTGPESSVHTLIVSPGTLSDKDHDGVDETVTVPYADSQGRFAIDIDYSVFGGAPGSGTSAFDEEIRITNFQSTALSFHFFEYVDLDLYSTPNDDTILLTGQNSLRQYDPLTVGNWSFDVDRYELNTYPNTVTKLRDSAATNLSSVWPAGSGPIGPANVTWALQWDFVGSTGPRPAIPPGQTAIITKEGLLQMVVPEPTSMVLAILGCLEVSALCSKKLRRSWKSHR